MTTQRTGRVRLNLHIKPLFTTKQNQFRFNLYEGGALNTHSANRLKMNFLLNISTAFEASKRLFQITPFISVDSKSYMYDYKRRTQTNHGLNSCYFRNEIKSGSKRILCPSERNEMRKSAATI